MFGTEYDIYSMASRCVSAISIFHPSIAALGLTSGCYLRVMDSWFPQIVWEHSMMLLYYFWSIYQDIPPVQHHSFVQLMPVLLISSFHQEKHQDHYLIDASETLLWIHLVLSKHYYMLVVALYEKKIVISPADQNNIML